MCNGQYEATTDVRITNNRYVDLIRKEERLSTLERVLKKGNFTTLADIKVLLGIEETEGNTTNE